MGIILENIKYLFFTVYKKMIYIKSIKFIIC